MKIKSIQIENFRHLNGVSFNFGSHLTVIAGGNGTGKTSLLGLIGHIFKYGSNDKTIINERFETRFSEVFKFSPAKDFDKTYRYKVTFTNNQERGAESRYLVEGGKGRFRIDVGGRVKNGGKIKLPVIYLSLKRLFPLAQENSVKFGKVDDLTETEKDKYNTLYNRIFNLTVSINPVHTISSTKIAYLPTTDLYDAFGISAGQDNIGQIILALIEFRRLKEKNVNYSGGLLLIDELDATLYPASQKNLLRILAEESRELDLQVVFTTHSSDILNFLAASNSRDIKIISQFVSLSDVTGSVKISEGFNELEMVLADLNHEAIKLIKPKMINVYFEDSEARKFYKSLIEGQDFRFELNFKENTIGSGTYKSLLEKGFEEFVRSIVVLDGDCRGKIPEQVGRNVVFLPGDLRPENIIKDFLIELDASDDFWLNEFGYTKRVFNQSLDNLKDDRESMKKWFNEQIKYWGQEGENIFRTYIRIHPVEASLVKSQTWKIVDFIIDNYSNLIGL